MTWIRSPLYDGFWILSAPVLGVLMLVPMWLHFSYRIDLPTVRITEALLAVNFAHALAPIGLAWSHPEYRRDVLLARPGKFLGVPLMVMAAAAAVAPLTWRLFPGFRLGRMTLENLQLDQIGVPLVLWANLYAVWNFYHAGAQNFGILCLYRRKSFPKPLKFWVLGIAVVVTVFVSHEMPRILGGMGPFLFLAGLVTVNHWFAAIGLAAHAHGRRYGISPLWFAAGVLLVGGLLVWGFLISLAVSVHIAILALALRAGLGIWHFLQDRWIWRMSDPRVRATIGRAFA